MLPTSARLLQLLSLLQSRRSWVGGELAEALGVTERSVRRDVERLRELGYPVHASAGVGGGYQLGAGKDLPPLPLEDDEAVAVAVGLRAAATGPVRGLEEASLRALTRLEQVLPKRLRKRVNALQAVSLRFGPSGPAVDARTLTALAMACREHELVRFPYRGHDGDATNRHVEPYHLVHTSFRWYLLAWDLERADWRTFRVDRIGSTPRVGRTFRPRPLPTDDVAAWVADGVAAQFNRYRARVTIHGPAEAVLARMSWITGQVEPLGPDRCLVDLTSDSLDALAFWLGFLGFDFEVHEPDALISHLQVLSERLQRAAARST